MRGVDGRVVSVSLDPAGRVVALIECPSEGIPEPGRFCLVTSLSDQQAALPTAVFAGERTDNTFIAVGELPGNWYPGHSISIRGPFGQGFKMPDQLNHLALAACSSTVARLMPLAQQASQKGADVAWFTDAPLPSMPAAFEINPLHGLPDSLKWADFLVVEVNLARLAELRSILGFQEEPFETRLPCAGQVLVLTAMPCGGVAACGVCNVPLRRGSKSACQDGPVFDLDQLAW